MMTDSGPTWTGSPEREAQRLAALADYAVLDTLPEADLDDIVRLAARICAAPVSLITLVDNVRQFFKARSGYEGAENVPLDAGFCPHVVRAAEPLVIPDTRSDPAYADNPATVDASVRFYAGVPLLTSDGLALGTLCVLDKAARPSGLDATQVEDLQALARQVMGQFELRHALRQRDEALRRLQAGEARHRQVLSSAVDYAIVTTDLQGMITGWNAGAEAVLGWMEPEVLQRSADLFFTPEDRAADRPEHEMEAPDTRTRPTWSIPTTRRPAPASSRAPISSTSGCRGCRRACACSRSGRGWFSATASTPC